MQRFKDYSLLNENTFGIDQMCDEYVVYDGDADAVSVAKELREHAECPYLLLGGGSNLLLTEDFHGKVVSPAKRFDISVSMSYNSNVPTLRCWAGAKFDEVVDYAVRHGYYGLENLSLIPGECGATAVQNIGAYGSEIKDVIELIEAVEISTGNVVKIKPENCDYAYRDSRFKHEWKNKYIITYVSYRLSRSFKPELDYGNIRKRLAELGIGIDGLTAGQLRDVIIDIRRNKLPDPKVTGNAGSFFMNPIVDEKTFLRLKKEHPDLRYFEVESTGSVPLYKIPAGWMIEQCGWKGRAVGKAGVYDKQALILINKGGASGRDIVNLMHAIQKDVRNKFGLDIKPEVNIL